MPEVCDYCDSRLCCRRLVAYAYFLCKTECSHVRGCNVNFFSYNRYNRLLTERDFSTLKRNDNVKIRKDMKAHKILIFFCQINLKQNNYISMLLPFIVGIKSIKI